MVNNEVGVNSSQQTFAQSKCDKLETMKKSIKIPSDTSDIVSRDQNGYVLNSIRTLRVQTITVAL